MKNCSTCSHWGSVSISNGMRECMSDLRTFISYETLIKRVQENHIHWDRELYEIFPDKHMHTDALFFCGHHSDYKTT